MAAARTHPTPSGGEPAGAYTGRYQLLFAPTEGALRLRELYEWDQRSDIAWIPLHMEAGKPFTVQRILHDDVLEVNVDEQTSLCSHLLYPLVGTQWGLSVQDGAVTCHRCTVYRS